MPHRRILVPLAFLLLFAASIAPIQSYDAYWHLATGRWILEHGSLPEHDPFGLASDPVPWHNGEWLFQIVLALLHRAVGEEGISIARGFVVALLFTLLLKRTARETAAAAAVLLCAVAFAGADLRLGIRPELAGIAALAVILSLLLGPLDSRRVAVVAAVTLLWINLHPSALLAPLLAGATAAGKLAAGRRTRRELALLGASVIASLLALLGNPHGVEGVIAPVRLARVVTRAGFVNLEWLPSSPAIFPLLYLSIAAGAALLAVRGWCARHDRNALGELLPRAIVFLLLAALAVRFVRNHGFFFVALPLLLAPAIGRTTFRGLRVAAAAAAAIALVTVPLQRGIGLGPDPSRFPVSAVDQLEASGLRGNLYNPDQFGGYLIWRSYPERRVLTDGRNELYLGFLERFPRARQDSRLWAALFREYELTLAVEEIRGGTMRVTEGASGRTIEVPPARVYFPESEWALIGFDDVALVFARRDAFPAGRLAQLEYRTLRPWVPEVRAGEAAERERARGEIERAERSGARGWRLEAMKRRVGG